MCARWSASHRPRTLEITGFDALSVPAQSCLHGKTAQRSRSSFQAAGKNSLAILIATSAHSQHRGVAMPGRPFGPPRCSTQYRFTVQCIESPASTRHRSQVGQARYPATSGGFPCRRHGGGSVPRPGSSRPDRQCTAVPGTECSAPGEHRPAAFPWHRPGCIRQRPSGQGEPPAHRRGGHLAQPDRAPPAGGRRAGRVARRIDKALLRGVDFGFNFR